MAAIEVDQQQMCAFPGCERPVAPAPEGAGRPPRYCERPEHTAQSAFRERRRRAADGEPDTAAPDGGAGERPVSLAAMTLRGVAQRFAQDLERALEALHALTNAEQLEAELAAIRADTHAEVSRAEQRVAGEQRARLEASEAAEDALQAAEDARARADAAETQAAQAIDDARGARAQADQAQRERDDALALAEAAHARAAAAERRAEQAASAAAATEQRAADAEHERDQAREQTQT